jgi:hypothetical protein
MSDIVTERSDSVLRIQLNRPASKNAMTSAMYITLAELFKSAGNDDQIRVVLWHGAGDSFCAGNDLGDFLKNPPGPGESPQALLIKALINFDKPIVAAVQGAAIGGGTTMLTHCDFVFAGENAKFQMPFVNLAVVLEFGSSWTIRPGGISAGRRTDSDRPVFRREGGLRGRRGNPGGAQRGIACDSYGHSPEAGAETARRSSGLQAADETINARAT